MRGNAHQVFDKYQALAREAASSGDRIAAEAYWQYADHYYRMIQTMGGFVQRNNQGWGDGRRGPAGQIRSSRGQGGQPQQANGNGHAHGEGGQRSGGSRQRSRQGEEPGLGGVAFLQNGRTCAGDPTIRRRTSSPRCRSSPSRPQAVLCRRR